MKSDSPQFERVFFAKSGGAAHNVLQLINSNGGGEFSSVKKRNIPLLLMGIIYNSDYMSDKQVYKHIFSI